MAARPSIRRRVRFVPSKIKLLGRSEPGVGEARTLMYTKPDFVAGCQGMVLAMPGTGNP